MADQARSASGGLTFKAYRGVGCSLLAFDYDTDLKDDLAGFAVSYVTPKGKHGELLNRLSFETRFTRDTKPQQRVWTPTSEAPLQNFHWVHFPPELEREPGTWAYEATAMLFDGDGLERGPSASLELDLGVDDFDKFDLGFTRGYISSQAYAEHFGDRDIRPTPKTLDYRTTRYEKKYAWLGHRARELLFDFLEECKRPGVTLDVLAYDLDEPDVVRALVALGPRLRLFLDDAPLHKGKNALEPVARERIEKSAGKENVKTGHFRRFAHDKVLIQRRGGRPTKVLTGSANFSVRGLYVQSNSMILIEEDRTADLYGRVFDKVWDDARGFSKSDLAREWFRLREPGLPKLSASFAPHASAEVSLKEVAEAVLHADSSVLYAVMQLGGTGPVLKALRALPRSRRMFSYGVTQNSKGDATVKRGWGQGVLVPFGFLTSKVPAPFQAEWGGGSGQVIHHKFVVVDFNDSEPVVFAGSSNLASGGEESNGDNLLAMWDRSLATAYAVEAIRLVDHYRFRAVMKNATPVGPLRLKGKDERWWRDFYDRGRRRFERLLFVR